MVRITVPTIKGWLFFVFMGHPGNRFDLLYSLGAVDRTGGECYIMEEIPSDTV